MNNLAINNEVAQTLIEAGYQGEMNAESAVEFLVTEKGILCLVVDENGSDEISYYDSLVLENYYPKVINANTEDLAELKFNCNPMSFRKALLVAVEHAVEHFI